VTPTLCAFLRQNFPNFRYGRRRATLSRVIRSGLPATARKIEFVAPEEIAAGARQVVQSSYGIDEGGIPVAVARLLGFGRTSEEITSAIASSVQQLTQHKSLAVDDGQVSLVA
jgi:hypothetical protein